MENQSQFKNDLLSIKKMIQNILAKEHLMLVAALKDHKKQAIIATVVVGGVFLRSV